MTEQKSEQVEWEVVDNVSQQEQAKAGRAARMRAMMGPWWRWKIAGLLTVAGLLLTLAAVLASMLVVVGVAAVLLSLAVAKIRQMLRQPGSSVTPR